MRHQQLIDRVDDWIVNRPRAVILAFVVVTLVMSSGLGMTATESGTDQFTEDIPAQEAAEDINERFETESFTDGTASTQLIQSNSNVLSKSSLLRMLEAQHRLEETPDQRVVATASVARAVALEIDPEATTLDAQIDALERTPASTVRAHTRTVLGDRPGLVALLSEDYNRESVTASATIGTVTHSLPDADSGGGGGGGDSPAQAIQLQAEDIVATAGGDIRVFGSGLLSAEFGNVIGDSLLIVVPAAVTLIFVFLVYAYRDPLDLLVGVVSLAMAILWTFGFMGLAGIAFTQMLIAVPPLLLAVGIDFGIHAVNRYREERVQGIGIVESMRTATDQLLVAFFIVTGTTVIGFSANLTSALPPIQDFGLVAGIGIIFTFLIFGIFLPAAKVYADQWRARVGFPQFGSQPLGTEESVLGKVLPRGIGAREGPPRRCRYQPGRASAVPRRLGREHERARVLRVGRRLTVHAGVVPPARGQPRLARTAPRALRAQRLRHAGRPQLSRRDVRERRGRHGHGVRRGTVAPGRRPRTARADGRDRAGELRHP